MKQWLISTKEKESRTNEPRRSSLREQGQRRMQKAATKKMTRQKGLPRLLKREPATLVSPMINPPKPENTEEFIKYMFTCTVTNEVQNPQCIVCSEALAHESLKPYFPEGDAPDQYDWLRSRKMR
ncbi:hypothetical protein WMY93_010400 [Mugilogobius chulae]|uniref:Uncharacterized protein n=1 Tax=Mugilogobius chulae TaxID=88201 RepID=A0AAW0PAK3_9GOBI